MARRSSTTLAALLVLGAVLLPCLRDAARNGVHAPASQSATAREPYGSGAVENPTAESRLGPGGSGFTVREAPRAGSYDGSDRSVGSVRSDLSSGAAAPSARASLPEISAADFEALAPGQQQMVMRLATEPPDTFSPAANEEVPEICFGPNTPDHVVRAFSAARARRQALVAGPGFSTMARQLGSRWSSTATAGTGISQGDPAVIRWSVVPDGTSIPGDGAGEPTAPSNLRAWLNARYGSEATWLPIMASVFQRWSELSGVTYIYEPNDDGATFPSTAGAVGVRGDVRISGHAIDGNFNILAYNFFPNTGDMVIDTSDSYFADTTNNSARLKLVMAHEHGHGLGLRHVCPLDSTKLMEPQANALVTGPMHDDIYSVQRLYGDRFEPNNTSGAARDLGTLPLGTTSLQNLSLDDNSEIDFYKFTPPSTGLRLSAVLKPVGKSYLEGAQNADGTCSAGTTFNSLTILNLNIDLRNTNGTTVLATANTSAAGVNETLSNIALPAGTGPFFLRINASNSTNNAQLYDLDVTLEVPPPPTLVINDVTVAESAAAATLTVTASGTSTSTMSATWTAGGGTATAGSDYTGTTGTVTIPAGSTSATISVPLQDDALDEDAETFDVALSDLTNATAGPKTTGSVTLTDDDAAPVVTLSGPATFPEAGGGALELTATLSAPSGKPISVNYSTVVGQLPAATPDDDYATVAGTLNFAPGETEHALTAVSLADDDAPEADEWLTVSLAGATNVSLAASSLSVRILDDDAPRALADTGSFSPPDANGQPVIGWHTVPGRFYRVEWSDDLVNWTNLSGPSPLSATGATLEFTDPTENIGRRYYRVLDVPSP